MQLEKLFWIHKFDTSGTSILSEVKNNSWSIGGSDKNNTGVWIALAAQKGLQAGHA